MNDFFTFYENIKYLNNPFQAFSMIHYLFVIMTGVIVFVIFKYYKNLVAFQKEKFLRGMAYYFIIEEIIYTLWLLMNCHKQIWIQILPLELCSLCVYINVCSIFTKKSYFRFFSAAVGLVAGSIAIIYPANINGLYPVLSYRVINFYILHGSFVLFAFIQLQDRQLLSYQHIKKNTVMICSMFTLAFLVNLSLHAQYMLVGIPPKISIIASLFNLTGIIFFLPIVLCIVSLLQFLVLFLLRVGYRIKKQPIQ